jgi:hypothetical protein
MDELINKDIILSAEEVSQSKDNMTGFVKIFATNREGKSRCLVSKKNLILYSGASILANVLSGAPNAAINYFYVSYCNSGSFTPPIIDLSNSNPITAYTSPFGFIRIPILYNPSFSSTTNYTNNIVYFTTQIAGASAYGGATLTNGVSNIFECALINAPNPASATTDTVFSRINFSNILYESSETLSIIWAVQFVCS